MSRIEKEKGRTAKIYWPLHRIGASQEVAAVEFNAMGDSLLGSLVLVEPTRLSFFDMPASLKKGREDGGCWRVDDDCEFHYAEMEIPAVLGEPGRQLVFFTFRGAEGQADRAVPVEGREACRTAAKLPLSRRPVKEASSGVSLTRAATRESGRRARRGVPE